MSCSAEPSPDRDEAIADMAAAWLVERDAGFTPEQAVEFDRWRAADPRHANAVALLEETSGILGQLPLLRDQLTRETATAPAFPALGTAEQPGPGARRGTVYRFPTGLRTVIAIAACVTLALAGWALQRTREARAAFSHTYTTASGDYLRIGLPDKSVLQVNADTTVHVQFNARERRVLLQRGEAHFAVAKNPARPFVVGAGQVSVRAVGTGFNVRIDSATVEVLVTEGRVQVEKTATAPAAAGVKDSTERAAPVLVAGQRVTIPRIEPAGAVNSLQVSSLDSDAVKSALEWQAPRLAFRETPLSEVVRQFNQHNRVQLVIGDTALGDRPVGGTFRADMVETFVGLLEKSRDVAVERPSPDRIILRRVTPAP